MPFLNGLLRWPLAMGVMGAMCWATFSLAENQDVQQVKQRVWQFAKDDLGKLPPTWTAAKTGVGEGSVWKVVADESAPSQSGFVVAQVAKGPNVLFNLCVVDDTSYKDLSVSVAFKAISGEKDQGGGIVWRYQNADNYYIARYNPLENNYRLYKVVNGRRIQLATKEGLQAPAGKWLTTKIEHLGDRIVCYLGNEKLLEATDSTISKPGKIGLWTKADAETRFDSLVAHPLSPMPAKVLHVAPGGNDQWSGSQPEANPQKSDGPFATLERAREEIRRLRQAGGLAPGGVTVLIRGGLYPLPRTFELTAEDSGTEQSPVVYRAYPGEEVRLSGGQPVTGFQPVSDQAVLDRLEEGARGKVLQTDLKQLGITDFGQVKGGGMELFFQERPMMLARWPNEGFLHIADLVGGEPVDVRGTKGDKIGKFVYEGDRPRRWVAEKDAWVHGYWFWDWADERHKVETIDPEKRVIAVAPPYHHYGYRKGQWFYGLNLLAELDSLGEWYLDRQSGILYFWPPGPIDEGHPTVSRLKTLVSMRNTSYVTLRGMTFEATRGTAITVEGGSHNTVAGCTLRNLGSWAVQISGGTGHGVVGCDIYGTADGGIALEGGDRKSLTPAGHFAHNNHIHHYSRWNRMYQPAISLGGVGHRAAHNLIHDAPHEAIAFGGNDHLIELNEIHHVCCESNDAGAIYAGRDWTMRGTVIRHNFLHDISGFQNHGCVGVYLDDMFSGTLISGNVFCRVTAAAFIGGGRDNVVENNLFIDCQPALHVDARAMGWARDSIENDMKPRLRAMPYQDSVWSTRYPKLLNVLEDEPAAPKGNLIARNACQGGTWERIEGTARPFLTLQDNLVADDLHLKDAARLDLQLRDDSPVYAKVPGFQKIPFEQIGLVKDEYREIPRQSPDWAVKHVDVFKSGTYGYFAFRIPAIETASDGSLLAFAEARKYNLDDPGFGKQDIDLVMKRSIDGGATWSTMKVIEDPGELWSAANPATVLDRQTNRFWLFYLRGKPYRNTDTARPRTEDIQTMARYSDDHGQTWSEPIDLTAVARDMEDKGEWRSSVTGPGGAIQDRKGRLIVPVWKAAPFGVFAIFSNDHGRSWQRGQVVPGAQGDENQLVELADGQILMDFRQNKGPHRWIAVSSDGGLTWSAPRPGQTVTPVACAIERWSLKSAGDDQDRIVWTGPQGPDRSRLALYVSYDEGKTFALQRQITDGFAAYSDLTILKDKSIGILWERGAQQGYQFITFTRLEAKP